VLEDVAAGEDEVVVVGVEVGGGGLEAEAGDEAGAGGGVVGVEGVFADDEAGGEEGLDLAVAGGAVPAGGVDFELGPEVLANVVLGVDVAESRCSRSRGFAAVTQRRPPPQDYIPGG